MRFFLIWPAIALACIVFYAAPLFGSHASIHWDLADVSYPAQKYFADSVHAGKLPHWTPFLNSGLPFLSDSGTGAWYPLHWPFFAFGITSRSMVWELALHAFLAMCGAFLLARRLWGALGPAVVGAMLYAWSGFFAAHSSNLPLFEAAALLPWLLWAALRALESGKVRALALTALIGGLIVLAGDPTATFTCLAALICFSIATGAPVKRIIPAIVFPTICAFLIGAVQTLPAMELSAYAVHPKVSGMLHFRTLATFIAADYYGVISGLYSGPDDIRQHYLYSGLLLVPLALAGLITGITARSPKMWPVLALIVPAFLYAFTPGLHGTAPMDSWFAAALGLAMAAASGVVWAIERAGRPRLWIALLVLSAVDLWYWNMNKNPLVYARASFAELYEGPHRAQNVMTQKPLGRTWSSFVPISMGPADGSLLSRIEVTYGLGLAELDRYADYLHAAESNSKLLNGLGVTQIIDAHGKIQENPSTLGRVSVPKAVQFVANRAAAQSALATLDPAEKAVVEASPLAVSPGVATVDILNYQDDFYLIRMNASGDSLLRIAVPYYPGWSAAIDGHSTELVPVDEALTGVFVPAGEHRIELQYRSTKFHMGVILSGIGVLILVLGLALPL